MKKITVIISLLFISITAIAQTNDMMLFRMTGEKFEKKVIHLSMVPFRFNGIEREKWHKNYIEVAKQAVQSDQLEKAIGIMRTGMYGYACDHKKYKVSDICYMLRLTAAYDMEICKNAVVRTQILYQLAPWLLKGDYQEFVTVADSIGVSPIIR